MDAGPRLVQKLMGFGDHRSARLVEKIAEEEVAHVAVGLYWFLAVCEEMGRTPSAAFKGFPPEVKCFIQCFIFPVSFIYRFNFLLGLLFFRLIE